VISPEPISAGATQVTKADTIDSHTTGFWNRHAA
jgi:hypothetical protein